MLATGASPTPHRPLAPGLDGRKKLCPGIQLCGRTSVSLGRWLPPSGLSFRMCRTGERDDLAKWITVTVTSGKDGKRGSGRVDRPPFSSLSPFLSFPHGLCTFSSWDRFFPTLLRTPPKVRGRQGPERGSDSSSLFGKWSQEALEGVVSDSEGEEARSGHAHKGIYGQLGFPPAGDCRDHPKVPQPRAWLLRLHLPAAGSHWVGASRRDANSQHICVQEKALGRESFLGLCVGH